MMRLLKFKKQNIVYSSIFLLLILAIDIRGFANDEAHVEKRTVAIGTLTYKHSVDQLKKQFISTCQSLENLTSPLVEDIKSQICRVIPLFTDNVMEDPSFDINNNLDLPHSEFFKFLYCHDFYTLSYKLREYPQVSQALNKLARQNLIVIRMSGAYPGMIIKCN